jgi:hypothetical protein
MPVSDLSYTMDIFTKGIPVVEPPVTGVHLIWSGPPEFLFAPVKQQMSSDASALVLLTLLALGTFTAGVHIAAWRICLVGVVLALAIPAIAWLEQATLLLLLIALVLVAIVVSYVMHNRRERGY